MRKAEFSSQNSVVGSFMLTTDYRPLTTQTTETSKAKREPSPC